MLRNVLGILSGYFVAAGIVALLLVGGFLVIGPGVAYRPGTYEVTTLWLTIWLVATLVAGLAGGAVCAVVSLSRRMPQYLAALFFIAGVMTAGCSSPAEPKVRPADQSALEAMSEGLKPNWTKIAEPLLGAVGVLAGAALVNRRRAERTRPVVEEPTIPDTD